MSFVQHVVVNDLAAIRRAAIAGLLFARTHERSRSTFVALCGVAQGGIDDLFPE